MKFSTINFLLSMLWVPLGYLVISVVFDYRFSILFLIFGIAGILGETILSFIWNTFIEKSIWTYRDMILKGYTSYLNFFPWTVGGLIFYTIGYAYTNFINIKFKSDLRLIIISSVIGLLLSIAIILLTTLTKKIPIKTKFSIKKYLVLCLPIFLTYFNLMIFSNKSYIILIGIFVIIGNITEYIYGKYLAEIFHERFWTYNYLKIDHGHSSFTNLILWGYGGLYFYFISLFINK